MFESRRSLASVALARFSALVCAVAALGCGSAPIPHCETAESIALHVHPAKHLNPDRAGLPRSVLVRVYQLGDARGFSTSSFDRIWSGSAQGLAPPEQLIALPGRNQDHALPRDPAARYLAVAANFREREGDSGWRAFVRLPAARNRCERLASGPGAPIELELSDYSIRIR